MAGLQFGHHAAHVLHAGGAEFGFDRLDGGAGLGLVQLAREKFLDDRELAAKEEAEIAVIERFLPQQLSDDEASAQIQSIIADTGASSMRDMGRVMAEVKTRLGTQIEPARASALVKAALAE